MIKCDESFCDDYFLYISQKEGSSPRRINVNNLRRKNNIEMK